jgi:hypothetical protein
MIAVSFSAIMIVGAFVLVEVTAGITEASAVWWAAGWGLIGSRTVQRPPLISAPRQAMTGKGQLLLKDYPDMIGCNAPRAVVRDAGLVMHWSSVLASANPLREGRRFVRPSRKDAGRHLCGRRDGVF